MWRAKEGEGYGPCFLGSYMLVWVLFLLDKGHSFFDLYDTKDRNVELPATHTTTSSEHSHKPARHTHCVIFEEPTFGSCCGHMDQGSQNPLVQEASPSLQSAHYKCSCCT